MTRVRIAIVGGGFSGAALAIHLAQRSGAPPTILVDKSGRFGRGLAYDAADRAYLLNVRASNMSLFPDRPDHFAQWLARRGGKPADFASRRRYGDYVEDALRRAAQHPGVSIERRHAAAVSCVRQKDGWLLSLSDGRAMSAEAVVLALGNASPAAPEFWSGADIPLLDPWDIESMRRMPRGDVLLLGTGLTAVDVLLTLARRRGGGVIYALSRRGQLPRAHLKGHAPPAPRALDLPLALSEALLAMRTEVDAMVALNEPWQHAIDRLRARTPELWRRLPPEAQQRFLRHLRPWWDAHRHRMAPQIAAQVEKLQSNRRLSVIAGEVVSAERHGHAISVQYRLRGSRSRDRLNDIVGVVNCTGAAMDFSSTADPLVRQLLHDGLARAHESGLGFAVDDDGRLIGASGVPHDSLYALGPITQGAFWESTAVPEIRMRATALAALLAP